MPLIDCADMQFPLTSDCARSFGRRPDSGIRSDQPRLSLHVSEGKWPSPIGATDRVPKPTILIDRANVKFTLTIDRASHAGCWPNPWIGADQPRLGLYVSEGKWPTPIRATDCVPEPAPLIDCTDVHIPINGGCGGRHRRLAHSRRRPARPQLALYVSQKKKTKSAF